MAASISIESATRGAKTHAALEFLRQSPKKLLINSKWVAPKSGKPSRPPTPQTRKCWHSSQGGKADVDEAVIRYRPLAATSSLASVANSANMRAISIRRLNQFG